MTSGDHELHHGELVEMLAGEAMVELVDGGSIELRADRLGDGSRLQLGDAPALLVGDALVLGPSDQPVVIDAGGARLALRDAVARVSRSIGVTFAVYAGDATLSSGGRTLGGGLPPLRQVVVPAPGKLPMTPSPLTFDVVPDPWDRRFLGDAIDLQSTLERRSTGLTASLRDDIAPDAFFFQAVLPGLLLEPAFDQAVLDEQRRPVGETLVGAAVALYGEGAAFEDRWREVFRLRQEGAGWGLVALELGAPREALVRALDEAVNRSPLIFAGPSPSPVFEPRLPPPRPPRVAAPPPMPLPPTSSPTLRTPPACHPHHPPRRPCRALQPQTKPTRCWNRRSTRW